MSNLLTVTKTKTNNNMPENNDITDAVLNNKFVQELLRFVSELRTALGDADGNLENHELIQRAKEAYKSNE